MICDHTSRPSPFRLKIVHRQSMYRRLAAALGLEIVFLPYPGIKQNIVVHYLIKNLFIGLNPYSYPLLGQTLVQYKYGLFGLSLSSKFFYPNCKNVFTLIIIKSNHLFLQKKKKQYLRINF